MKTIFLRKNRLGLSTIRGIIARMSHYARIARVDIPSQPIPMASQGDIAINWGTMASPSRYTIVNTPQAILKASEKGSFRHLLYRNGLSMPTYLMTNGMNNSEIDYNQTYVHRPNNHKGGKNLRISRNYYEFVRNRYVGGYASLYIPKVNEYRVFVAQGRVAYVVKKIVVDSDAIAWNVEQGGRFENVRRGLWNLDMLKKAVSAVSLAGLHFGAVDVIEDAEGNFYVLEVNTAPAISGDYWSTCVAKIFDYMIDNGVDSLEPLDFNRVSSWKHFIHPALYVNETNAIVEPTYVVSLDSELTHDIISQFYDGERTIEELAIEVVKNNGDTLVIVNGDLEITLKITEAPLNLENNTIEVYLTFVKLEDTSVV